MSALTDHQSLGIGSTTGQLVVRGRLVVAGRVVVASIAPEVILGVPRAPSTSFVIPDGYVHVQPFRLVLGLTQRASLRGSATLVVSDDFGTRSRITLTGRG